MAWRMASSAPRCNEKGSRSCLFDNEIATALRNRRRGGLLPVTLAEFFDAARGIHDLLLARVEGVARRAHFHVQRLVDRRARLERDAAAARHIDLAVLRMNVGFHLSPLA